MTGMLPATGSRSLREQRIPAWGRDAAPCGKRAEHRTAANSCASGVWRMLTDDSSTIGSAVGSARSLRAKATPSMSGMCMSVMTTSK